MDKLNNIVTERLAERLLVPDGMRELLEGLMKRQALRDEDYSVRLAALRAKLTDAEQRLSRLTPPSRRASPIPPTRPSRSLWQP